MKKILYFLLKLFAKAIISKYQPKVVGITGSVGKTSAKEAIFAVVKQNWRARQSFKNYNNEIGLPLTILGRNSVGKNLFSWLRIFLAGFSLLIIKNKEYPQILVLEMAADRKGDIDYLTSIAKPDIAVITAIGSSHLEHFGSIDNIVKEKSSILKLLTDQNYVVLNNDDQRVAALVNKTRAQSLTFGQNNQSDVQLGSLKIIKQTHAYGMAFELRCQGNLLPVFLPNILGKQHALAIAAATTVGLILGMELAKIQKGSLKYRPARGRTNLLPGIKNSWIIDDTYNSSPESARLAINILKEVKSPGQRIAVLGDMLELGAVTEKEHQDLGKYLASKEIDYLFVIGERARDIRRGAIAAGMNKDKIYHFPFTIEAGLFLQDRIKEGDIVLVKGSRGIKMEQVVYEIMAKPWEAKDLLVGSVK